MKFNDSIPIYGDIKHRDKKCPPESAEQITLFGWLRLNGYTTAIHPRNEGKRSHQQTNRQKAEGMTAGASDVIIPGNPSFVCELKRKDHTLCKWEPDQINYLLQCKKDGCFVCVALGHQAAIEAIKEWKKKTEN